LETLPNIDINIKCGNSLVSRFAIDSDLNQALKQSKWNIESYRMAVSTYRTAQNKEQKREMERLIADIKSDFRSNIDNPFKKRISVARGKVDKIATEINTQQQWGEKPSKQLTKELETATAQLKKLEQEKDEIENNKIFENAFEWRFEFPEVLDNDGKFVGFDVVIGNPPYGVPIKDKIEREYLISNIGKVPDFEIYYWFINKGNHLLKEKGIISYIIPNTILFNVFAQSYRLSLFDDWKLNEILDCTNFNVFEDATVRNIIFQFTKSKGLNNSLCYRNTAGIDDFESLVLRKKLNISKETAVYNIQNWGLIFKLEDKILEFIKKIKTDNLLGLNYLVTQGYIPYRKSDLIKVYGIEKAENIVKNREWHSDTKINSEYKEEIWGESISKYNYEHTGSYVWYGQHLATYVDLKYFNQKRILIREITNPTIIACLIQEEFVNDPQIINVIQKVERYSLEFLWAILNSKLATFYHFNSSPKATKGAFPKILVYDVNNFPLPKDLDENTLEKIESIVDQILTAKKQSPTADTSSLESEIDRLVYELYGLTEEEIKIVEGN